VPLESQGVQAWDRYAYVNNNPVRYTDPTGHDVGCAGRDASECKKEPNKKQAPSINPTAIAGVKQIQEGKFTPPVGPSLIPGKKSTSTPNSPVIRPSPPLEVEVSGASYNINWDRVDKVDVIIDVLGISGDIANFFVPEGTFIYGITEIIEGASFLNTVIDLIRGDPSNFVINQAETLGEKSLLIGSRFERLFPVVGVIGNLVSLGINIGPAIEKK
jgi:hypothetical protein